MAKCSVCGQSFLMGGKKLVDGEICSSCYKKCIAGLKAETDKWDTKKNTVNDVKQILENPNAKDEVLQLKEKKVCARCGDDNLLFGYKTIDEKHICQNCSIMLGAFTRDGKKQGEKKFIAEHEAEYLVNLIKSVQVVAFDKTGKYPVLFVNEKERLLIYNMAPKNNVPSVIHIYFEQIVHIGVKPKDRKNKTPKIVISYYDVEQKKNKGKDLEIEMSTDAAVYDLESKLNTLLGNSVESTKEVEQEKSGEKGYGDLIELKRLLDLEIITQEEFDKKKEEILKIN